MGISDYSRAGVQQKIHDGVRMRSSTEQFWIFDGPKGFLLFHQNDSFVGTFSVLTEFFELFVFLLIFRICSKQLFSH
jgi:hypothetical protein